MRLLIASFTPKLIRDLAFSLKKMGLNIKIASPLHTIPQDWIKDAIRLNSRTIKFQTKSLDIYAIRIDGQKTRAEESVLFCSSLALLLKELPFCFDILIACDWQTSLLLAYKKEGRIKAKAGIFFLQEMEHGFLPKNSDKVLDLPGRYFDEIDFYGEKSLLKAGILYSDAIVTLSPTYTKELQNPEYAAGLDELIRKVKYKVFGILGGVDYQNWDPEKDIFIKENYSEKKLKGKISCKIDLLEELKIPKKKRDVEVPIIAMVTELEEQKGCTLVIEAAQRILSMPLLMVIMGRGDPILEDIFLRLSEAYPNKFYVFLRSDPILCHKIIAGADMLLMPSLLAPYSKMHIYSMRYGTIPIVRATGMLNDTVTDPDESTHATGFKFQRPDPYDMLKTIERAISVYKNKMKWNKIVKNAMKEVFSWDLTAEKYLRLFSFLLKSPLPGL